MRSARAAGLLVAQIVGGFGPVQGQVPEIETRAMVVELTTRDRWIPAGQPPEFFPLLEDRDRIHLRALQLPGRAETYWEARLGRLEVGFRLTPRGSMDLISVDLPPAYRGNRIGSGGRTEARRRALRGHRISRFGVSAPSFGLPIAQFWELPVPLPVGRPDVGRQWTDTLSFVADPGEGLLETLEGVWTHEVLSDTVIDGVRYPVVSSKAAVEFTSNDLVPDESASGDLKIQYRLAGTVTGQFVFDPESGFRLSGQDTARWAGLTTLTLQDGRAFDGPGTYERVRTWQLHDSIAWAAAEDSRRAERRRNSSGMFVFLSDLEKRLRQGDVIARDSLLGLWQTSSDPDQLVQVGRALRRWAPGDREEQAEMIDQLRMVQLERGDTAGVVHELLNRNTALSERWMGHLIPYLDDLGALWRLGILPRWTFSELAGPILESTPILQPDSTRWTCPPASCRRLRELVDVAREPRLRDLALVANFARAPGVWHERLQTRADSGSLLVTSALRMAEGVATTSGDASNASVPGKGGTWQDWLSWMGGEVGFGDRHKNALLMYEARTGVDPIAELKEAWPAPSDSARLVVGTILRRMAVISEPTAEEVAAGLLSGSATRILEAEEELRRVGQRNSKPAPDSVAALVLGPLLQAVLQGGDSPWPSLPGTAVDRSERIVHRLAVSFHGVTGVPIFVSDKGLPSTMLSALPPNIQALDSATWSDRDPRDGGVLIEFDPVRVSGPFLTVAWDWTVYQRRTPDESPSGYAGGGSLILLRTEDGWRAVSSGAWIT